MTRTLKIFALRYKKVCATFGGAIIRHSSKNFAILLSVFIFNACTNPEEVALKEKEKKDSIEQAAAIESAVPKTYKDFSEKSGPIGLSEKPGPIGLFEVPEMLTLCIHDSADLPNMAKKFAHAYSVLQEELKTLKLEPNGAPGSLYFNNDPKNFIFECVYPISKMPANQPKKSKVVVLEAANMYIYNYYGPYGNLYTAYEDIRKNLKINKLEQSGPMREFYVTDAAIVKDSTKWLTRILVPVMPIQAKEKANLK